MNILMLPDFSKIVEDAYRPLVEKGAAWLDEYEPGWVQKIAPDALNLADSEMCICGQVFGDYSTRPEAVMEAWNYGFCTPEPYQVYDAVTDPNGYYGFQRALYTHREVNIENGMDWPILDRLWLDQIWWRTNV